MISVDSKHETGAAMLFPWHQASVVSTKALILIVFVSFGHVQKLISTSIEKTHPVWIMLPLDCVKTMLPFIPWRARKTRKAVAEKRAKKCLPTSAVSNLSETMQPHAICNLCSLHTTNPAKIQCGFVGKWDIPLNGHLNRTT